MQLWGHPFRGEQARQQRHHEPQSQMLRTVGHIEGSSLQACGRAVTLSLWASRAGRIEMVIHTDSYLCHASNSKHSSFALSVAPRRIMITA